MDLRVLGRVVLLLFGVLCVYPVCAASVADSSDCKPPGDIVSVVVERVIDGDTVQLTDGRRVRLIGVNTPELARNGVAGDPLGARAKLFLEARVADSPSVNLVYGVDRADRYGRVLAHLFDKGMRSLEVSLLESGLAHRVVVSPNIAMQDCFSLAEKGAKKNLQGVWASDYWVRDADKGNSATTGFRLLVGVIEKVNFRGNRWWIDFNGNTAFYVTKENHHFFDQEWVRGLVGKRVEVRGWLTERKLTEVQKRKGYKSFTMQVSHPWAIEVVTL